MKPVINSFFANTLLSAALMGAGLTAIAQTAPTPPAPADHAAMGHNGPTSQKGHMGHGGGMDPAKMEAQRAKHLTALKERLKITPAQESAWTTFTGAMKPMARTQEKPDHTAMEKLSTPERIDKMRELRAKRHADHQAAMDQREQAVKTFYATLSAEQKKVMDAEHARMGKAMHHMRAQRHHGADKKPATPAGS